MSSIQRNLDIVNNSNDLEHLHTFENFPIFMGITKENEKKDKRNEMSWWISKSSGMIQLSPLIPLEELYFNAHAPGEVGKMWEQHHEDFSKFVIESNCNNKIFEIGGASGILANKCHTKAPNLNWKIIEPNPPSSVEGCKAKFIKGFFDNNFNHNLKDSTVIHSHVLEHIYDPHAFMKILSDKIDKNGKIIFSIPNMEVWLKNKFTNYLNFEHTYLLNETYCELFLKFYGFKILNKKYFMKDHSIFYSVEKKEKNNLFHFNDKNSYLKNKKLFIEFLNFHKDLINDLNKIIDKNKSEVYLFGAHIFSQFLINFGLKQDKIVAILDNDASKQLKRLYGTTLQVNSPKILKNKKNPTVILRAGVYNEEIKKDIISNINSDTIFI